MGRVRLIFQYNEESTGGMDVLLNGGILDDIDKKNAAAIALHVFPGSEMPVGTYSCLSGPANSSVDGYHIKVIGKGVHGAMQYKGHSPINAAVQIYTALNNIVSTELDARNSAVLSGCYFCAGSEQVYNVIPNTASFGGSIRTFDDKVRQAVKSRLIAISQSIACAFQTTCEISFRISTSACINAPAMVQLINCCAKNLGMVNKRMKPQLVSDDFSFLSNQVPGCYIWIGAGGNERKYASGTLHAANVCFNEAVMPYGVSLLVSSALKWLRNEVAT